MTTLNKLNRVIKFGDIGDDVLYIQTLLNKYGFYKYSPDGIFGTSTLASINDFQKSVGIKVTGTIDIQTFSNLSHYTELDKYKSMNIVSTVTKEMYLDKSYTDDSGLEIYSNLLSDEEFFNERTTKTTIFLHHTAGSYRPDNVVAGWEKDYDSNKDGSKKIDSSGNPIALKVATSYIIGRSSHSGNNSWDGIVVNTFDDACWAYHLGIKDRNLNKCSIGIELCNWGGLIKKNDKYWTYVGTEVPEKDVIKLDKPFRGYEYYERYTDTQIKSLKLLLNYLSKKHVIDLKSNYTDKWFDFDYDTWTIEGGLRSHSQVRIDKNDVFPQKELIDMLNSL